MVDQCGVIYDTAKELFLRLTHLGGTSKWAEDNNVQRSSPPPSVSRLSSEMRTAVKQLLAVHPLAKKAKEQQEARNPDASNPSATQFSYIIQVCVCQSYACALLT